MIDEIEKPKIEIKPKLYTVWIKEGCEEKFYSTSLFADFVSMNNEYLYFYTKNESGESEITACFKSWEYWELFSE